MKTQFVVKKEFKSDSVESHGRIVFVINELEKAISHAKKLALKSDKYDIYVLEQHYSDEGGIVKSDPFESLIKWVSYFSIRNNPQHINPKNIKVDIFDRYSV